MQKFKLILLATFFLFTARVFGQKNTLSFKKFVHISKMDTLPYALLSPTGLEVNKKYPLVIFLHGAGERGNDNESQTRHVPLLFNKNTLIQYPAFVVAPQCPKGKTWSSIKSGTFNASPTQPMKLFLEILDKLMDEYPIDPTRIYITGVSMGGYGTWDLMARFPNRFAAAVPVCGGGDETTASRIQHIPVWVFHGALDKIVLPERSRNMVEALREAGGSPEYTEYPDVKHDSWKRAYRDPKLLPWMFTQHLKEK